MADQPKYETRFFNARSGEVALTCCTRCGGILFNAQLHEEMFHAIQDSTEEAEGTEEAGGETSSDTKESESQGAGGVLAAPGGQGPRSIRGGTGRPPKARPRQ